MSAAPPAAAAAPTKRKSIDEGDSAAKHAKVDAKEEKKTWKSYPLEVKATKTYGYQELHRDMESDNYAGTYGGSHAAFHALAAIRAKVDLKTFHAKRSPDEFFVPELHEHLQRPETRRRWNEIVTMDPLGMYAEKTAPTISATTAHMDIPELKATLVRDGTVVNDEGCINVIKCSVDYVWNLPALSERLGMELSEVRAALAKYTGNPDVLNPKFNAYLPPIGGITIYFIGDLRKLHLKSTQVAVRVHDACCGSDVFGTDICTCRPYLIYAIQQAVEVAQAGGVGLIIYYMKEGRSLGEVTKFRVYNARKAQKGGDTPEMYFYQTESIAGIRDARFQEMMPDVLVWLGVERIDHLLSMSADKYDGITGMGITVMQRKSLPDMYVPKNATVEITAKVSAGYHTESIKTEQVLEDLRSLESIRRRCGQIYSMAKAGETKHFALHPERLDAVADYVVAVTRKQYPTLDIPYHSRWRHFDEKTITAMTSAWPCHALEAVRRKIDLVTVSVLLDAGAGTGWAYTDKNERSWTRSEGIAVASLDMFIAGYFSSDVAIPHRVNAHGLKALSLEKLSTGFQLGPRNRMVGIEGRWGLLHRLGDALDKSPEFFGREVRRPGHLVDYVLSKANENKEVSIKVLWDAVVRGFESVWPENLSGVRRGDVWVYTALRKLGVAASDMIPFHKLSQWLTYSLLEPIESLGVKFTDMGLLTGLAEYRNGGLFVDLGVITPKDPDATTITYEIGSELVVEWRALTICLLDEVAVKIRAALGKTEAEMPLARILQGGTWQAGRQIAQEKRPETPRMPPFVVRSDGTVF